MSDPYFSHYSSNIVKAADAEAAGNILSMQFKDGEIKSKQGAGWLISQLQQLWYVVTRNPEGLSNIQKQHYQNLLQQNWQFLNNTSPSNKEFQAVKLTDEQLTLVGKISHLFAEQTHNLEPVTRVRQGFHEMLNEGQQELPPYARELIAEVRASGLTLDELEALNTLPSEVQESEIIDHLAKRAQCIDLAAKGSEVRAKIAQEFDDVLPFVEPTPSGKLVFDAAKYGQHVGSVEIAKIRRLLRIVNTLPTQHLEALEKVAEGTNKAFYDLLALHHAQFMRACMETGTSTRVPISYGVLRPDEKQLKIALELGYLLFQKVPAFETKAGQAFFARAIQYLMIGDKIKHVPPPKDSFCFTSAELQHARVENTSMSEEIAKEEDFLAWLVKDKEALNYALSGFFKDVAQGQFPAQIFLRRISTDGSIKEESFTNISQNPTVFERFLLNCREDFAQWAQWEELEKSYLAFQQKTGIQLPQDQEAFETFIDAIPVSKSNETDANHFKKMLKDNARLSDIQWKNIQQLHPNLARDQAEKLWRFSMLRMLTVMNTNFLGLPGTAVTGALADAGIPYGSITGMETHRMVISPWGVETENLETYSTPHDSAHPMTTRPDYPQGLDENSSVPLVVYTTGVSVPSFNAVGTHAYITHFGNIRVSPFAVDYLDRVVSSFS